MEGARPASAAVHPGGMGSITQILFDPYVLCVEICLLVLLGDFIRSLRTDAQGQGFDDPEHSS